MVTERKDFHRPRGGGIPERAWAVREGGQQEGNGRRPFGKGGTAGTKKEGSEKNSDKKQSGS